MEAGADVNKARNNGAMPLLMAAQFGNETLVRALIKAGADVNRASNEGVRRFLSPLDLVTRRWCGC